MSEADVGGGVQKGTVRVLPDAGDERRRAALSLSEAGEEAMRRANEAYADDWSVWMFENENMPHASGHMETSAGSMEDTKVEVVSNMVAEQGRSSGW